MEETSALNNSELAANTSEPTVLPHLVVIFTPVLLVQFLVGLVSNLLLIALLVKANSVNGQNNVNIYLYSMATNNLLSLFPVLTLLLLTVTKEWVLGQAMCLLNQFAIYAVGVPYILLQVCISRERYRAVVHFSEWIPYSRRTYIHVAVVWICAICTGVMGVAQGGQIPMSLSQRDKPISWEAEVRTLKSLACAFFVSLVPFVTAYVYYIALAVVAIKEGKRFHDVDIPQLHVGVVCLYLTPVASPVLLTVMNKRFRMRMKDLFRWQLKPTSAVDPNPVSRNKVVPLTQSEAHPCKARNGKEQLPL
ncbi:hypothetical protein EMCRGX_G011202 [Ephydatia muelleri]